MAMGRITIRERIDPAITASLFSNYRSSADAVLELVDNAVDSRLPAVHLSIEVMTHPTSLVVLSAGGDGMGVRELERNYLRWGGSAKRGKQLLGQYGQGGKAAIGHLGKRFTVEASRPGDEVAWQFTDDDYRNRSRLKTYDVGQVKKRLPAEVGYVRIRVDGVDKRMDMRRLAQRLGETYAPLLESGGISIVLNGSAVERAVLPVLERKPFQVNAGGGRLKGWLGMSDPDQSTAGWLPGLRCYKFGRLIADGEFFNHPGPAQVPALGRLMGEVEIPNVPLTMNKSDFDRDSPQWVEVESRLHRVLAPIVRRLEREGEAPPPANAVKVAEQVRRLLGQALRLTERADIFAGFAAVAPQRRPASDADNELPLEVETEPISPKPRVPPPAQDSASAVHRGFGTIVIRPLDRNIRSLTTVEEGVRVVVINSNYPLFKERRGDIWYQLETAAREVCRAAEGANVAEYERRVNEIVLMATALRDRRRAPGRSSGEQLRLLRPS
jgi:Histidine kinase-, DNA gyrase B-, and HSP90-like ATPase